MTTPKKPWPYAKPPEPPPISPREAKRIAFEAIARAKEAAKNYQKPGS